MKRWILLLVIFASACSRVPATTASAASPNDPTVTIIGMIAAFITASVTAFLAEPVRTYFQNRARKQDLRVALYRESLYNYLYLYGAESQNVSNPFLENKFLWSKTGIRSECYRQAISQDLFLFYKLPEAEDFNEMYAKLHMLSSALDTAGFLVLAKAYIQYASHRFQTGRFDRRIMKRLLSPANYWMIRGEMETRVSLMKSGKKSGPNGEGPGQSGM